MPNAGSRQWSGHSPGGDAAAAAVRVVEKKKLRRLSWLESGICACTHAGAGEPLYVRPLWGCVRGSAPGGRRGAAPSVTSGGTGGSYRTRPAVHGGVWPSGSHRPASSRDHRRPSPWHGPRGAAFGVVGVGV